MSGGQRSMRNMLYQRACTSCPWEAGAFQWPHNLDEFAAEHEKLHPGHKVFDPLGQGYPGQQLTTVAEVEALVTFSIISWRSSRDPDEETVALVVRDDGPDGRVTLEHTHSGAYWESDPERMIEWPATVIRVGRPSTEGTQS